MIDLYEVLSKLNGRIDPVGESHIDVKRFKNLQSCTSLVLRIIDDIQYIVNENSSCKDGSSSNKSYIFARDFLRSIMHKISDEQEY